MSGLRMKSVEFRRERQRGWLELETLVEKAEASGLRSLSAKELGRLSILYRSTLSSLNVARSISLDRNLLLYLENLTSRAYLVVYGVRRRLGEAFSGFLFRNFPRAVRAFRWHVALSAAFFVLGLAAGYVMTIEEPDRFYTLVPEAMQQGRGPVSSTEELREILFTEDEGLLDALIAFATFLFTHNAQIGILAFSLGIAAGVPVFYLLFSNGGTLGAFGAVYHQHGLGVEFWGWVLPHGVTELGAIILCGGAGLILADGLILPGRSTRLRNLASKGKQAGIIVLGCVLMFFVAALVEGLFRQLVHSTALRYLVATLSLLLWLAYFARAGRRRT